jgi:hypothetical protein
MNARENIIEALNGGTPDMTPLTFYSWMVTGDKKENENLLFADEWKKLYDMGLGICHHIRVIKEVQHGVKDHCQTKKVGADTFEISTKETPVGKIQQVYKNGWHHKYWIKSPQDYNVMTWILENTELVTCYEEFQRAQQLIGNNGVVVINGFRTPAMSINVDWAGTERFCTDVALQVPELIRLYEVRKKLFLRQTELIAKGPGKFVKWMENLTISMLGPEKYAQLLMPIYNDNCPILQKTGKRVMVHYDGALRVIKNLIANAPFNIIDSLTEPPEGDMLYDDCRQGWPNKVFWANINVALYNEPAEVLTNAVLDKVKRAGKKALAFEISEEMPSNYKKSIPIVLNALSQV